MILTDAAGHALYIAEGTPTCTGNNCGGFTPVAGKATSGDPKVQAELIGVTTLLDGSIQITYAGQPRHFHQALG